jgi:hypothetical protein
MKTRLALLLFTAMLSTSEAWAGKPTVLPDACGADIKFDVKTQKNPPAPTPPEEGKARLILIAYWSLGSYDVRFGMDGKWLGATKGNSYFVASIAPGEHHFCGSVQNSSKRAADLVGTLVFTAEAGKTYYLEYAVSVSGSPGGMVSVTGPNSAHETGMVPGLMIPSSNFFLDTEDDGKYRVKAFPLATSTPKN